MSKWISVKERLPEEGKEVLVYIPKYIQQYFIAFLSLKNSEWSNRYCANMEEITHWQPLPSPPEDE